MRNVKRNASKANQRKKVGAMNASDKINYKRAEKAEKQAKAQAKADTRSNAKAKILKKKASPIKKIKASAIKAKDTVFGFVQRAAKAVKTFNKKNMTKNNLSNVSNDAAINMAWLNVAIVIATFLAGYGVISAAVFIVAYKLLALTAAAMLLIFIAIQIGFGIAKVVSFLNETPVQAATVRA